MFALTIAQIMASVETADVCVIWDFKKLIAHFKFFAIKIVYHRDFASALVDVNAIQVSLVQFVKSLYPAQTIARMKTKEHAN